jgi:hypothetical protein
MSDNGPPLPPKPPIDKTNLVFAAIGVIAILAVLVAALRQRPPTGPDGTRPRDVVHPEGELAGGGFAIPPIAEKEDLTVGSVGAPSVWLDVRDPAALRSALAENAWLKQAAQAPLGKGFLDGWAAFLGSRSEDLGLADTLSKGTTTVMQDLLADALLSQPARVTFFEGSGAPAVVVPKPSATVSTTVDALSAALARGGYTVAACPGEQVPEAPAVAEGSDAGPAPKPPNPHEFEVVRWRVADHVVYVATARERLAFSQESDAVIASVCGPLPAIEPVTPPGGAAPPSAHLSVSFDTERAGREAHTLAAMLGFVGEPGKPSAPSLDLAIDGTRVVPVGIRGALTQGGRLAAEKIPDDTWKLIPEDAPALLAAELALPKDLDTESLSALWSSEEGAQKAAGILETRHLVVVWQPHGDDRKTDVAVVWSRAEDKEALAGIFAGPNRALIDEVCGRVVIASTPEMLARIQATCSGKSPSVLLAKPDVKAALQQPMSVGIVIDFGRALSTLLMEGWKSDGNQKRTPPPEIDDARKLLLELPRAGWFGTRSGSALEPRGFSS